MGFECNLDLNRQVPDQKQNSNFQKHCHYYKATCVTFNCVQHLFVFSVVCFLIQPFNSEAELAKGLLYLVLGLTVQHVGGGESLDGHDDVASAQVGEGGLTARGDLQERARGEQIE